MSKKKTSMLIALGALLGASAAGLSYYLKYKSFNNELDKDFHDYEEEDTVSEETGESAPQADGKGRTYITLDSGKGKPCEEESVNDSSEPMPAPAETVTVEEDTDGTGA